MNNTHKVIMIFAKKCKECEKMKQIIHSVTRCEKINAEILAYDCEDDEKCDIHDCVKVTGFNGFAANHTWIQYECNNNTDCNSDEFCENHFCKQITQGTCGEISNHQWVDYECCDDSECEDDKVCRDNKCQEKGLCGFLSILLLVTGALGLYSFRKL